MTSSERRPGTGTATAAAGAMGAKTARACDSCLRRRARWYCAADDAFLCQSCDASVHSANPLASRHDRVRLKSASDGPCAGKPENDSLPPWLHGLRRKARTPRKPGFSQTKPSPTLLVPDLDHSNDDSEEQLLYRVPIFDPIMAEFCSPSSASDPSPLLEESKPAFLGPSDATQLDHLPTFLASDTEFADFAADVESLLGRGMSEDAFCMEGLGLLETREDEMRMEMDCCFDTGRVKQEEDEKQYQVEDLSRETLELNFGYESPTTAEEEEEEKMAANFYGQEERKVLLRLDYKAVITAWGSQGSPWVVGDRPTFNLDDAWPDCIGTSAPAEYHPYGEMVAHATAGDGGREARVSRYREKRRTRLFSKKIRYEVRKLNAEKRPRMKGRFVKRASFAAPAFPF